MAKTMNQNPTSTDQANGTQKQRKKQAKLEAKAMLAVEQAKASVEKAQRKLAKAQQRLESRITRLHARENQLSELRSSSFESGMNGQSGQSTAPANEQETATVPPGSQPNVTSEEDEATSDAPEAVSSDDTSIPTDQEGSEPPAEGRADILPEDQATSEQGSSQDEPSHEEAY